MVTHEPTSLKEQLRTLMVAYSAKDVYLTLQEIFKQDYDFYKTLYENPSPKKSEKAEVEVPRNSVSESVEPRVPKVRADSKIRHDAKVIIVKKTVEQPVAHTESATPAEAHQETFRDPKDIKKWQKEQEDIKCAELKSAGTDPNSLLTKENLKKWIDVEGRTYAFVAREYVGLSETAVSQAAKELGVQSAVAKRRAIIASKKKK